MQGRKIVIGLMMVAGLASRARASSGDFEFPANGTITGKQSYCGGGSGHNSLDIAGTCGDCVVASRNGTASAYTGCGDGCGPYSGGSGCNGGAGNYVAINHDAGYQTRYLHMKQSGILPQGAGIDSFRVGWRASTGSSTGSHLHFDMWQYGVKLTSWLDWAGDCGSQTTIGNNINYDFPSIDAVNPDKQVSCP